VKTQLTCDGYNALFTTFIIIAISWIILMVTLEFTNVITPTISFSTGTIVMGFVGLAVLIGFISINFVYVPRRLAQIRKRFIETV
jgi:hypothetical protein